MSFSRLIKKQKKTKTYNKLYDQNVLKRLYKSNVDLKIKFRLFKGSVAFYKSRANFLRKSCSQAVFYKKVNRGS